MYGIPIWKLLKKLSDIATKHGSDTRVLFDTEAAAFNVHCVPINGAYYISKLMGGGVPFVVLTTRAYGIHGWKVDTDNNKSVIYSD